MISGLMQFLCEYIKVSSKTFTFKQAVLIAGNRVFISFNFNCVGGKENIIIHEY